MSCFPSTLASFSSSSVISIHSLANKSRTGPRNLRAPRVLQAHLSLESPTKKEKKEKKKTFSRKIGSWKLIWIFMFYIFIYCGKVNAGVGTRCEPPRCVDVREFTGVRSPPPPRGPWPASLAGSALPTDLTSARKFPSVLCSVFPMDRRELWSWMLHTFKFLNSVRMAGRTWVNKWVFLKEHLYSSAKAFAWRLAVWLRCEAPGWGSRHTPGTKMGTESSMPPVSTATGRLLDGLSLAMHFFLLYTSKIPAQGLTGMRRQKTAGEQYSRLPGDRQGQLGFLWFPPQGWLLGSGPVVRYIPAE